MKKLFTLAAAVLASLTMTAQTTIFSAAPATSSQTKQNAAGFYEFTSEQATVTGGHMFMAHNDGTSARKYTDKQNNQAVFALDGSKGWFKIKLNVALQEGDTIIVEALTNGAGESNARGVWVALGSVVVRPSEAPACALLAQSETGKEFVAAKHIIQSTDDICGKDSISIWRATGNSTYFKSITIVRPEQREVDHVDVSLGGVAVNGEALSDTQMATLYGAFRLDLTAEYVEAPTVTFTVQTDTYYVGEETPSTKSEKIDVVATLNPDGKWQAQQTVGEQTYTITAVKPATANVTYMDGETVLGTEIVKVGESATKHGEYEVKPLAEFQGWYTDAGLTSEADLTAAVNADKTLYGKFVKAYAQSLNIEQLVVTNGKSYGIKDALTAAGYEYSNLDALDSLNNEKGAARNEPYLGLKIKTQGGFIACNVATGSTIRVKFGYVENNVLAIAGNDTLTLTPANKTLDVLEFTAEADTYVKIQTTSGKTVVIKQIMVDEAITDVMYKITYAEAEHGTVSGWTIAFPNEEVKLSFTLDEGYTVASCFANDVEIVGIPNVGEFFTMPAEAVTVSATFSTATAIENTEAAGKAVKVVRNGQLFIEKNGVVYNAQGAIVK